MDTDRMDTLRRSLKSIPSLAEYREAISIFEELEAELELFTVADRSSIVLTRAEATAICEVLIVMANRLPMEYRDHAEALGLLRWSESWSADEMSRG